VRRSSWDLHALPIGEAIFFVRRAQRLTGPMLSVKSGVHRNTLLRIEQGLCPPSLTTLVMIAEALEIELSALVNIAEKLRPAQQMVQHVAEDKIA
jgi:transcriptional regulator with XRE-family HTH domain